MSTTGPKIINFTPSIYYDPNLEPFTNDFLRIMALLSTFCYIFLMFLILKKSEKLQKFKWLLIVYMTSSYLYSMFEAFFHLIPLFPAIIISFKPFFGLNYPWLATLGLFCFEFSLHAVIMSLVGQIIYKFIKVYPNFGAKHSKLKIAMFIYFSTVEIIICIVTGWVLYISVNPYYLKEQAEIIANMDPKLLEFVGNSLIIVFTKDLSFCFLCFAFSLLIYILIAIFAIIYLRIKINKRRKKLSTKTMKSLNMIFYLMATEVICAILFLGGPGILCFLHAGFPIYFNYPISAICILITSTHFIIASIAMMFTIRPYRKFVFSMFIKDQFNRLKWFKREQ